MRVRDCQHSGRNGRFAPGRGPLAVAIAAALLTGCALVTPPGAAPLRYRDPVASDVAISSDLVYGTAVDQAGTTVTLRADVYSPVGDAVAARPFVIFVHGGSFRAGSKTSAELVDQARFFAQRGYVTASITYRLGPTVGCVVPGAECVVAIVQAREDAQAAVRFFRSRAAEFGIDPERIAIAGTSAGAITALNVGYGADLPDATVDGVSAEVRAAVSLSGAALPGGAIDANDAPALLFHGTADPLVPYGWATATVDAAQAAGLTSYLVTWVDAGHVPYVAHREEILTLTANFLYWTIGVGASS